MTVRTGGRITGTIGALLALVTACPALGAPLLGQVNVVPSSGWNGTDRVTVAWTVASPQPAVSGLRVDVNLADDGTGSGAWTTLTTVTPLPNGFGTRSDIPLNGLEGRHALRVVVWDAGGSSTTAAGVLSLDHTPPQALAAAVTARTPVATTYSWQHRDTGGSGLTALARVEVETTAGGDGSGPWTSVPVLVRDGDNSVVVGLPDLAEGAHVARLRSWDAAGNAGVASLPPMVVDRTAPVISGLAVLDAPTPEDPRMRIAFSASDDGSGLAAGAIVRAIDVDGGRELARGVAGPGRHTVDVDLSTVERHRVVLRIADRSGNEGQSAVIVADPAAGSVVFGLAAPADPRVAALRGARIVLTRRTAPAAASVRTIRFGSAVVLRGRLIDRTGAPLAGMPIAIRDARRRTVGTARTGAGGWFTVRGRPRMSGPLRVGVPVGGDLLPARSPAQAVRVRPVLQLRASTRRTRAGGAPVAFVGTIRPSPRELGFGGRNVVVEWRDPIRGTWRPMANLRADAAGIVRTSWAFNAGGFAVPVRLRLLAEPGWPTEPGVSRALTITVS